MDLSAELNLLARNTPASPAPSQTPEIQIPDSSPSADSVSQSSQQPALQAEPIPLHTSVNTETCLASRQIALNSPSLADETASSRSLSGDDADMDSLPSLSYTTSEPPSSALSRSSSLDSSAPLQGSMDVINSNDVLASITLHVDDEIAEEDPLSYHSDFDYYTQSLSDLSDSEPDPGLTAGENARHHSPPDAAITPYNSLYVPDIGFEPGTYADTMRRATLRQSGTRVMALSIPEPPQDGVARSRGQPSQPERQSSRRNEDRARQVRRNGDYSGGQSSAPYGGGAGGDDNNGDKARRGNRRLSISSTSSCTSSSDDDADGITVYYSLDGMSNGPPSGAHSRTCSRSKTGGGSDDDVPLAQRVPTALSAQKSIRKQLHDERQQRKLERAKSSRTTSESRPPSRPTEPVRAPAVPTGFRKRSLSAAPAPPAPAPAPGPRTVPVEMFAVEDLTRKLANLQSSSRAPPLTAPLTHDGRTHTSHSSRVPGYSSGLSRSSSRGRHTDQTSYPQQKASRVPEGSSQDRPLRSMRSFHRSDGRHSEIQRKPAEQTPVPRLGRSTTAATPGRAVRTGRDTTSAGHDQYANHGRVSEDSRRPSASTPRVSVDREGDVAQRAVQRPPVPPLPIPDSTPPQHMARGPVVQQRIFIGDMQRFNTVEITPATNAGDVVETVASQGMLDRSGSWMLFEMAQDYGMGGHISLSQYPHTEVYAGCRTTCAGV